MPNSDAAPELHEISLYGANGNVRYLYFYGAPQTLSDGDTAFVLTEGDVVAPLAVEPSLLVNMLPYVNEGLEPITEPSLLERIPFTTDLQLSLFSDVEAVVYFDGQKWFTLIEEGSAGFNAPVSPRERIGGLRGLGQLFIAEAAALQEQLEPQGPMVVTVVSPPAPRLIEGVEGIFSTALYIQTDILTSDVAYQPPPLDLIWDVVADGSNAAGVSEQEFRILANEEQLIRFWNQAYGSRLNLPALPLINFGRESLVAVFMGAKPSGGFSIEINNASLEDGELYVDLELNEPPLGAITTQALTSPWVLMRVNRSDINVAWFRDNTSQQLVGVARQVF